MLRWALFATSRYNLKSIKRSCESAEQARETAEFYTCLCGYIALLCRGRGFRGFLIWKGLPNRHALRSANSSPSAVLRHGGFLLGSGSGSRWRGTYIFDPLHLLPADPYFRPLDTLVAS